VTKNDEGKSWTQLLIERDATIEELRESLASSNRALDGLIAIGDYRGQTVGVEQEVQLKVSRRFLNAANNKIELVEEVNAGLIADNQNLQGDLDRAHDRIVDSTRKLEQCVTTEYHDRIMASAKIGRDKMRETLNKAQAANTKLTHENLNFKECKPQKEIKALKLKLRDAAKTAEIQRTNNAELRAKVIAQREHLDARQVFIDELMEKYRVETGAHKDSADYWNKEYHKMVETSNKYQRLAERLNGPTTYPDPGDDRVEIEDLMNSKGPGVVIRRDRITEAQMDGKPLNGNRVVNQVHTLMERMDRAEKALGIKPPRSLR
jgi:hypothetical protein